MTSLYTTGSVAVSLYTTGGVRTFGPPNGDPASDAVDPATLTTLRQVTNNTAYARISRAIASGGETFTYKHEVRRHAKALRLQHTNRESGGGGDAAVDDVITRAGFLIGSTFHPVTFAGAAGVTVPPGTRVVSDPGRDTVQVAPGDVVYSVVEMASGRRGIDGHNSADGTPVSTRYVGVFRGEAPTLTSTLLSGAPTGIYGLTNPTTGPLSVTVLGDSFAQQGWPRRALDRNGLAWSDWSVWLDRGKTGRDGLLVDRMGATGDIPFDVALVFWGGNDRDKTYEQWVQDDILSWRLFEASGQRVATKTVHPYTYSTDGWTSVEGQTLHDEATHAKIVDRNNWLRDGAPINAADDTPADTGATGAGFIRQGDAGHPLAFPVFDEADATSTARDSGIWRVDGGAWTADGIHLSGHGVARMADAFSQWVADNLT